MIEDLNLNFDFGGSRIKSTTNAWKRVAKWNAATSDAPFYKPHATQKE